ncbi:YfgM family protein [Enterobacteriaceae bacterium ESL0689]|nr:YfgM family protein [Enterobacteriaceae bacterium ESL0689]
METYNNEHDQIEALKYFFIDNGKALAIGAIIGIAALVGWRYWSTYQQDSAREASLAYEKVTSALASDKPEAVKMASQFVADNKNSYGAFASLKLAQYFGDKNDWQNAEKQLQQGLAAVSDDNLHAIIAIRLARVQQQLKKADDAQKTLDSIKSAGWEARVADLRGDILLNKGDKQGARAAWEEGVKNSVSPQFSEVMLMKINNLAI